MADTGRSRRKFLGTLVAALGGLFLLGGYLTPRARRQRTLVAVPREELPEHGALVYREARVAVIREGGAVYALNLVCTHLGCTVQVFPGELVCPCHGSRFDRQGRVLKGPADRPLERYRVELRGERYEVLV